MRLSSDLRAISLPRLGSLPSAKILMRRVVALTLLALVLAAVYLLWLRDVGLVAVTDVNVRGAGDRSDLVSKVEAVGLEQSTLHVDQSALLAEIADDPAVSGLAASTDFPHGLEVTLDLRAPAAFIADQGIVVAGDGVVLERTDEAPAGLPEISVDGTAASAAVGEPIDGDAAAMASVLGAAPGPLAAQVSEARNDPSFGILVIAGDGIELRFGDPERAEAKWRAAAAVLADPQLGDIGYIDLSLPERPVAGSGTLPEPAVDDVEAAADDGAATGGGVSVGEAEESAGTAAPAVEDVPAAPAEPESSAPTTSAEPSTTP